MAIVTKGSGGSIKFSGTGGSLSITSSGGGGGGGSPINPSSLGDLKLRFLGGDYSTFTPPSGYGAQNTWNAISPGSTLARVYDASQNSLVWLPGAPSFNGNGSAYMDQFTANNYDSGTFLDIPGGSTARTLYMVAHVPDINAGANPTRMFIYGSPSSYSAVGFVLSDGYIYGTAEVLGSPPMNLVGDGASTKGAPISSATTFVVSYSYAAGSDLKDNPIYVNGVLGTYGAGTSGVINSHNNGSGIIGSTAPYLTFQYKHGYGRDPSTAPGAPFYVADLLIFNTEHNSSTRAGVESWLMTQYGIS